MNNSIVSFTNYTDQNITNTIMSDISWRYFPNKESAIILISILGGIIFLMFITIITQMCRNRKKFEYEEPLL